MPFFDVRPLEEELRGEMFILRAERLKHTSGYSKQLHSGIIFKDAYSEGRNNGAAALGKYPDSTFDTVKYILIGATTKEIIWEMPWFLLPIIALEKLAWF